MDSNDQQFIQRLICVQPRIRAFIGSIIFDHNRVDDILQQANVVLVDKAEQFAQGTDFGAWACKIAYFEVLADRQRYARQRMLFDNDLVAQLADTAERETQMIEDRRAALRVCLEELHGKSRSLLYERYSLNRSATAIAKQMQRPVGSIRQTLYRIRMTLMNCIESKMKSNYDRQHTTT